MDKLTIQRNLISVEDLLLGTGTVTQTRGTTEVEVTKINGANFPYDDTKSFKEKIDSLETAHYVDVNGIPTYILTPHDSAQLDLTGVLWIKDVSASLRELYYEDQLILQYDVTNGNLIIPPESFADVVSDLTDAYELADTNVAATAASNLAAAIATRITAENALELNLTTAISSAISALSLGTAAAKNTGTAAGNVVELLTGGKLPVIDGSNLTGLPSASIPAGTVINRSISYYTASTLISTLLGNTSLTPANTVGVEILSKSFTPAASGNKLLCRVSGSITIISSYDKIGKAGVLLFVNGTFVKGLPVISPGLRENNATTDITCTIPFSFEHEYTTVSGSAVTVSVRVGPAVNTSRIQMNTGMFNNGTATTLVIEEVKV